MGAMTFFESCTLREGETVSGAFNETVERAQYDYGHGGYTGTIAEKSSFRIVKRCETQADAESFADEVDAWPKSVDDKWGPAGAATYPGGVVFFGWASS